MDADIKRMWINQPSGLQDHHALHGTNVLAVREEGGYGDIYRVYFLSGPTISMQMRSYDLSHGWRE